MISLSLYVISFFFFLKSLLTKDLDKKVRNTATGFGLLIMAWSFNEN